MQKKCQHCGETFSKPAKETFARWDARRFCTNACKVVRVRTAGAWSEERAKELETLWLDGMSAGAIAQRWGISRNAVIGKVHRMGLHVERRAKKPGVIKPTREAHFRRKRILTPPKVTQMRDLAAKMRDVEPSPPSARLPNVPPSEPGVLGLSILLLEPHHCRFPINDEPPFLFCGKPKMAGSSYCSDCHSRCFTQPRKSTKRFVMNVRRAA